MSIDRVATSAQTAYFLTQIQHAGAALDKTQAQIASVLAPMKGQSWPP